MERKKNARVADDTSWDELMAKATANIFCLEITPRVLWRLYVTAEEVAAMVPPPKTWVELAILQALGDADLVPPRIGEALDFHRKVTDKAAGHLALVADNTFRTPWTATKLLSTDRIIARTAGT